MRVLFLGMQGQFTRIVLEQLVNAGTDVCGLLISGPKLRPLLPPSANANPLDLPLIHSFVEPNALHLAWQRGIPVYESGPLAAPDLAALVRELAPGVACVACFDRIIPAHLLSLPQHGFLNVHPSLLPDFRGPEPLFWQLRAGIKSVGVTVHWMDAGLDSGEIAGQRAVYLDDGTSGVEADALCARAGGDLLAEVLSQLADGREQRVAQPAGGSYQSTPVADDFRLDRDWTARRAFNFMRGTAEWGMVYPVTIDGHEWLLAGALAWEEGPTNAPSIQVSGHLAQVHFANGTLIARLAE